MSKVIFLVVLMISTATTASSASKQTEIDENTSLADVELSNIRDDLNLWMHVMSRGDADRGTKEKISRSMLRKIILVGTLHPRIELLRGDALEALCLMTEPSGRRILDYAGDTKLVSLASSYLTKVEPTTKAQIAKRQQTMKGTGCYITPKRPGR